MKKFFYQSETVFIMKKKVTPKVFRTVIKRGEREEIRFIICSKVFVGLGCFFLSFFLKFTVIFNNYTQHKNNTKILKESKYQNFVVKYVSRNCS